MGIIELCAHKNQMRFFNIHEKEKKKCYTLYTPK